MEKSKTSNIWKRSDRRAKRSEIWCWRVLWEQRFQKASPPTNHSQRFWNFSWIFFRMVLTKLRFGFSKIEILTICFSFSLTWDPMKVKISKRYSSYTSQPKVSKLLLNFPPNDPHKTTLGMFGTLSFRFIRLFFKKIHIHHCTLWRNQKLQLSEKNKQTKNEQS